MLLFGIVTVCSDEKSFRPLQVGARNALVERCAEPREAIMGLQSFPLNMPAGGFAPAAARTSQGQLRTANGLASCKLVATESIASS